MRRSASIHVRLLLLGAVGCLVASTITNAAPVTGDRGEINFDRDIRPIFSENCLTCHGPDEANREAELRLDTRDGATAVLWDDQRAIVPGDSQASTLVERISSPDPDLCMPPPDAGAALSKDEIELLKRWIDQGAPWQEHWAFRPIEAVPQPTVNDGDWVKSPIDAFVLSRLESQGIEPSPAADRYTLIKRLHYDLIGLPPTPDDVAAFVSDRAPGAYERLVDGLLASSHFGERWGRHWLDKARYADTNGYETDQTRTMWPYRDWVIKAINDDLPFDQFTVEQIAGDMLPNPTTDQILATAFHRNTMSNVEGGTDDEEFRVAAVVDRVNTTMEVWMGISFGCAQCHDHKYDPLTQREYYEFFALLNQTEDADKDDNSPTAPTPSPLQADLRAGYEQEIKQLQEVLNRSTPELAAAQVEWEEQIAKSADAGDSLPATLAYDPGSVSGSPPGGGTDNSGVGLFFEANRAVTITSMGSALREPKVIDSPITVQLFDITNESLLHTVTIEPGAEGRSTGSSVAAYLYMVKLDVAIPLVAGHQYAIVGSGYNERNRYLNVDNSSAAGVTFDDGHGALAHLDSKYGGFPPTTSDPGAFKNRIAYAGPTFEYGGFPPQIVELVSVPSEQRSHKQQDELSRFYRTVAPQLEATRGRIKQLQQQLASYAPPAALIMRELATDRQRQTHIHLRGSFLNPGEAVSPGVPRVLHELPSGSPANRLGLARWLAAPENPLVPRVAVNHVWKHLFGAGLVPTANDFGVRGERPTHPQLLDYLAGEYLRLGWSRKALIKAIVMSATYQQSSRHRPELVDVDPNNLLLYRQNRFRIEGEIVRDVQLAASGLLAPELGGPSVFPPIPPGITDQNYNSEFKWKTSVGADRYRRGMYTFFKRTAPHPNLITLDCPESSVACASRNRSTTPLGALVTLNNEVYIEAAQALGRRLSAMASADDQQRIRRGFQLCVVRPPSEVEMEVLLDLLTSTRQRYRSRSEKASQRVGNYAVANTPNFETASWIAIARVMMNLDEMIVRD
ncbi:PSD1 and planctomycete cytochrome C domain-containing protein [Pirellulales bacterium]|nr:PSD1 and planctomycete cytochrome C domain-containing protein [Pirellulales bacterium]